MRRSTGFIHALALVLMFSAVVPCGLIELAAASLDMDLPFPVEQATEGTPAADESAGDQAQLAPLDCCADCLSCCASYTEAPVLKSLTLTGTITPSSYFVVQRPQDIPFPIWRPPRI